MLIAKGPDEKTCQEAFELLSDSAPVILTFLTKKPLFSTQQEFSVLVSRMKKLGQIWCLEGCLSGEQDRVLVSGYHNTASNFGLLYVGAERDHW